MNKCFRLLKMASIILVSVLLACSAQERWEKNSTSTYAYEIKTDRGNLVDIVIYDMKKRSEVAVVPTGASVFHRYRARWVKDSCILLESSDIGCRLIDVAGDCQMYYAKILRDGNASRVVLYDDSWAPVGREVAIE